jgi:DNA polymerase III epsilon subunit-like protein
MKILIFDTETTGLPKDWKIPAERQPNNWPHIVSIGWMILNSETNKVEWQKSYIIKPKGWTIPEDSTAIHGIRHSFAENYGAPLESIIKEFFDSPCDMYVAHNMNFDENVMMNAVYWDLQGELYRFRKPTVCSMKLATPMCRLRFNSGGGLKPPKLSELYEHVFRRKPIASQLHGSFYDAKILTEVIQNYEPMRIALGLVAPKPIISNGLPQVNTSGSTLIL